MTTLQVQMRRLLSPGDPAPWFKAPVHGGRSDFSFASIAGPPVLLVAYGSAGHPLVAEALARIESATALFDGQRAHMFGVSIDPADVADARIPQARAGIRHFLDHDGAISRALGAAGEDGRVYCPHALLLDQRLTVVARYALGDIDQAIAAIAAGQVAEVQDWAPVITVPRVLEPDLCRALIDLYEAQGGTPSGFMREVDGKTTLILDNGFKRRADAEITDPALRQAIVDRVVDRLVPAIERAYAFRVTRIERYIVASYDAGDAGFFHRHRDNTTAGTAHRRFAVTINLNEDYDGGELRFPEFGMRTYRAPPSSAIVFSCSLLHEVTPMRRGRRYATLPFLYDDAAAAIREANNAKLAEGLGAYQAASAA